MTVSIQNIEVSVQKYRYSKVSMLLGVRPLFLQISEKKSVSTTQARHLPPAANGLGWEAA